VTREIDTQFLQSLKRRNRLRGAFSVFLIGIYLAWGVCGVYYPECYAAPFMGIAMPTGLAMAFAIIGLSMLLAVIYVRRTNRFEDEDRRDREPGA